MDRQEPRNPSSDSTHLGFFQQQVRRGDRALLVLAFALLVALRFPNASLNGRFWAEEGSVFYANAWSLRWWDALFHSHTGYLNIVANGAGLLAYLVPIEIAPHVTSGIALVVHCLPAVVLAFAKDAWLQTRGALLAALLIIATPPGTEEVWLNSLGSQHVLALSAAIVLALEIRRGAFGALQKFVLALASLSAPASWCLFPLFFFRAILDRSWQRAIQALILLGGVLVQFAFFFDAAERQFGIDPLLLNAAILMKHVSLPLLGHHQSAMMADHVVSFASESPYRSLLLVVVPLFLAVGCATLLRPRGSSMWLFLAGTAIAALSYYAAQNDRLFLVSVAGSARYAYAPQALFGLSALSFAVTHAGFAAVVAQVLVAWMLLVGMLNYFRPSVSTFSSGPNWPSEVRIWKQSPAYEMKIWPTGWTMRLPAPP